MDIKILKERYGSQITLCGHIKVDKLSTYTPKEIDELVKPALCNRILKSYMKSYLIITYNKNKSNPNG